MSDDKLWGPMPEPNDMHWNKYHVRRAIYGSTSRTYSSSSEDRIVTALKGLVPFAVITEVIRAANQGQREAEQDLMLDYDD